MDPELEFRHDNSKLSGMQAKHVDDIKIGAEPWLADLIVKELEAVFGKLSIHRSTFTNCGIRNTLMPDGSVVMDQDEYIKALIPIVHPDLTGAPGDSPATPALSKLFWSLLGALAYSMLTQHWLAVYVVSLQRSTHSAQMIHIRRLNALVRIAQERLVKLTYPSMNCCRHVMAHSDSC